MSHAMCIMRKKNTLFPAAALPPGRRLRRRETAASRPPRLPRVPHLWPAPGEGQSHLPYGSPSRGGAPDKPADSKNPNPPKNHPTGEVNSMEESGTPRHRRFQKNRKWWYKKKPFSNMPINPLGNPHHRRSSERIWTRSRQNARGQQDLKKNWPWVTRW